MLIKVNKDLWVNLYQINDLQIINNTDGSFSPYPENEGFLIVLFMNFGRFIVKDILQANVKENEKENEDENKEHYTVINDFYILDEVFKTETEAENFVEEKFGVYMLNNQSNKKIN